MFDAISHERLKQVLTYNKRTGVFRWKRSLPGVSRRKKGDIAGYVGKTSVRICIDYRSYKAHRLAWFYVHGEWPKQEIDHKNGVGTFNPIENLRPASRAQNGKNIPRPSHNTSGHIGVSWRADRRRWKAEIRADGKDYYLGLHRNFDDAVAAREAAEIRLFGEFRRVA